MKSHSLPSIARVSAGLGGAGQQKPPAYRAFLTKATARATRTMVGVTFAVGPA